MLFENKEWQKWPYAVFVKDGKICLIGEPSETHNCDQMGCTTIYHVVARAEVYRTDMDSSD